MKRILFAGVVSGLAVAAYSKIMESNPIAMVAPEKLNSVDGFGAAIVMVLIVAFAMMVTSSPYKGRAIVVLVCIALLAILVLGVDPVYNTFESTYSR